MVAPDTLPDAFNLKDKPHIARATRAQPHNSGNIAHTSPGYKIFAGLWRFVPPTVTKSLQTKNVERFAPWAVQATSFESLRKLPPSEAYFLDDLSQPQRTQPDDPHVNSP